MDQPNWAEPLAQAVLDTCKAPALVEPIQFEHKSPDWLISEANKNYRWDDPRRDYPKYIKGLTRVKDLREHKVKIYLADWDTETIIHETLHYCVFWMTEPANAIYAQELVVQGLTIEYILMDHIQEILKELRD